VRTVEIAKPGAERREIPDGLLPGLYLVLQPSGARSWAVRYRHHGRPCKHTLGPYPAIDLASARKLASAALRAVAEGRNPAREKKHARVAKADDIETVTAQFIERHCNRSNRPRTAAETARLLQQHVLPRLRGRARALPAGCSNTVGGASGAGPCGKSPAAIFSMCSTGSWTAAHRFRPIERSRRCASYSIGAWHATSLLHPPARA